MVGVKITERDESLYSNNSYANPCLAVVGTATKGPIGVPTLCVNQKDLRNKFGLQNPNCIGLYAANFYLAEANRCYYVRVAKGAVESKVNIPGSIADGAVVEDLIVLKATSAGTAFDGYSVAISESSAEGFTLTIIDNKNVVVKSYKGVSLDVQNDNYIGKVLANDANIALDKVNPAKDTVITNYVVTANTEDEPSYVLSGGNDGITGITSTEYNDALDKLKPDTLSIELMSTPGVVDVAVIDKALEVASKRGDCLYFVDPPSSMDYEDAVKWHNGLSGDNSVSFNSNYGAMYWSWQYIYDEISNQEVLVPPSVVVAPAFARSDAMSKPWYAPAGLTRGLLKNVLRSEFVPDSEAQDLMYTDPNNINPIITHASSGLVIFGQKTLWRQPTALNRVNVRRLITYIKHAAKDICQYLVFEPNDSTTWNKFEDLMDPILRSIKTNRGLYDYKLVKTGDIITDNDTDNYTMPVQILIKPTRSAEYIPVDIVLVSSGTELQTYGAVYNE